MLKKLLEHHILANLTFVLALAVGVFAYTQLPREQDPSVNFNWVDIKTYWPGAAAPDVEKRITDPLEDGLEKVSDIKFVSSTSRVGVSSILVRFEDLGDDDFDQRVSDLRREIQSMFDELPSEVEQPDIVEITSSNAFPTATLVVRGQSSDDRLHTYAKEIKDDLERFGEIERVVSLGYSDPELHVNFRPSRLIGLDVSPIDAADSVAAYFTDLAAGQIDIGDQKWLVRLSGTTHDPTELEQFPITTSEGELPLRAVADVAIGREDPRELIYHEGKPGIVLLVFKKEKANNLELLEQVNNYLEKRNQLLDQSDLRVTVLDDQTGSTKNAIRVMERNALIGLILVMFTVSVFLGFRIALVTTVGIPFVLAGTFAVVLAMDQTLNAAVLIGVVISLGMLVDDAIVVVEAIHFRLDRGLDGFRAARQALADVMSPVTSAALTTIAAFLPLIFMPGVVGDFMRIVPLVVSIALVISLLESFWMLPSHTIALQGHPRPRSQIDKTRRRLRAIATRKYVDLLLRILRRPKTSAAIATGLTLFAVGSLGFGVVKVDFFATDYYRLFYVNVEMPVGTNLKKTARILQEIESVVREKLVDEDIRGIVSYAGQQITDKEVLTGYEKGQVFVSLPTGTSNSRPISKIIEHLKPAIKAVPGPMNISFLQRKTGPPTTKPVSIKVRGNNIDDIRAASSELRNILAEVPGIDNIIDDDSTGGRELSLRLDPDAIVRAGVHPGDVIRILRLFTDGEEVASMQHLGEKVGVRVRMAPGPIQDVKEFLSYPVNLAGGGEIALGELLTHEAKQSTVNIRHYDFRRAITVEADIDNLITDTLTANSQIKTKWNEVSMRFPGISLDFSGELDDVQESLGGMARLFLVSLLLIFLILATQFKSYLQPLLILATIPMAFIGVVIGLAISGNPLSLFTLYGVVALAGIVANDAIVMISTANRLSQQGLAVVTASVLAARRRLMPIVITTLTTIAGLFSLAAGLGGQSLMWGPIATAIVWGLGISTVLTLLFMPLMYNLLQSARNTHAAPGYDLGLDRLGMKRKSLFRRAWVEVGKRFTEKDPTLAIFQGDEQSREVFEIGENALRKQEFETAIRCFEELAAAHSDNFEFNLLAAQAHVGLMDKTGWDIGYFARAERFLLRARALRPKDEQVAHIEAVLKKIQDDS